MKKLVLTTAILAIGAVAAQADVFINDITGVANASNKGSAEVGTVVTTKLIVDNDPSGTTMIVTLSDLNLDDQGGLANDSIALTFTATTDGGTLQTSGSTAAGWLSSGGNTMNLGSYVEFAYTSAAITADDLTGISVDFLGFTSLQMGSWGNGNSAIVNGVAYSTSDGVENKNIDLTTDGNTLNLTHVKTEGNSGGTRPENYDLQLEITAPVTNIPEPATLGMVAAFGGAVLFIRRRLMM